VTKFKESCTIQEFILKKYSHLYIVKRGDNLSKIALKFGYKNPGPIYAFPLNEKKISKEKDYLIKINDILYIPWHPEHLEKMSEAYIKFVGQANLMKYDTIEKMKIARSNIDSTLLTVDVISMIVNIFKKALMLPLELSEEAAKEWVEEFLKEDIIDPIYPIIYSNLKIFQNGNPYIKFIPRAFFEFSSPSFLATSAVGIYEMDKDLFLGGVSSYQEKIKKKITIDNSRYINQLNRIKEQIERLQNMKFYRKKI